MLRPLLMTKLFVPQLSNHTIIRKDILNQLISGYEQGNQLTLVCAPAGYGKSTIVQEFLAGVKTSTAWISLDEGDNDTQRFLTYLLESLKHADIVIGTELTSLLSDITFFNPDVILTLLINQILLTKEKVILVFDDYHYIRNQKIHELMKAILDYQPVNLHIVIISREDPQLPLARLRMNGRLTELRAGDLLFSKEESTEFLQRMIGYQCDSKTLEVITGKTEGWAAGLLLAALILKDYGKSQVNKFTTDFNGANSYLIDYLLEEVLNHLDQDLKDFLCRTSILERMNDKLCDELLDRTDSKEILFQLEKKNLFLIPLDLKKEWYRYHHLFADSLKTYLAAEEERRLFQKASVWMKKNGFSQDAVRYSFLSKDTELIRTMVEDSVQEAFENAQLETLVEWLEKMGWEQVARNEVLCVRMGIALFIVGRGDEGLQYMKFLGDSFLESASAHNKGLMLSLQAMLANISGSDSEPLAAQALQYLEAWDPIARVSALNTLGRARYRKMNLQGATEAFEQAYQEGRRLGFQFVTTLALMNYSSCLKVLGNVELALQLCNQYLEGMRRQYEQLPPYVGTIYLVMSEIYFLQGKPEAAEHYGREGKLLCKSISFDGEEALKIYKISRSVDLEYGERLSEREIEILGLLGKGLTNKEIADALYITVNTTQWHLSHIYEKLCVKNRSQAVIKAKETGILK